MAELAVAPDPADTEAPAKQLRFDGMPVTTHKVVVTGSITVSEEVAKGWKLGKPVILSVVGVVSSRRHKAGTNFGEPTGDAEHQITIHVHDLDLDD